ncbi:DUF2971 domain-containing protein [Vibrio kanaloae]|uniref:DUF2971 domain-containing protein n=1 Tax=Vibrio kanaloae TaxID=170673 RepID=UPI00148B99E4|nr:DUF2971 domain-containing protein [Vibrio kanaloae]NOJ02111.1 DUF2971 domain-containing protein [Vibrio kanaloae]
MIVFKYLPIERLDVICDLKIRFTQLSSLNDLYETYHSLDMRGDLQIQLHSSLDELEKLWGKLNPNEQVENKNDYENAIITVKEHYEKANQESLMTQEITNMLDKTLGILSLSQSNSDLLMWSHYSDSHCGYVIAFDSEHEFFHKKDQSGAVTDPIHVEYAENKLRIKLGSLDAYKQIIGTKALEWSYEQEVRLTINFLGLHPLKNNENRPVLDQFGNKIYLIDIPKEAIKAVYLGPRVSDKTKTVICESLKKNRIECSVYQGVLSGEKHSVIFDEI